MVPRIRLPPTLHRFPSCLQTDVQTFSRGYAIPAITTTPASSIDQGIIPSIPIQRYPNLQPPSHRRPDFQKTQVLRQYVAILRSTPIMLLYQHNSVIAREFAAMRRELRDAMTRVDKALNTNYADYVKLQVIRNGIFDAALRLADHWHPSSTSPTESVESHTGSEPTHSLSNAAYNAVRKKKHGLEQLLTGPLAIVTIPFISPEHLKAVFSILSPNPQFPAPRKRLIPSYYDLEVQSGLQKLMLIGARIEGKVFDVEQARWVGGIEGGLDGLRAQLVAVLQSAAAGLTSTLDAAGQNLYFTLEGRKGMLDKESRPEQP